MRRLTTLLAFAAMAVLVTAGAIQAQPAKAVDITGQWTASFDTQIGMQNYTYDFVVKDGKLTGKAKSSLSDAATDLQRRHSGGDTVKFVETFNSRGTKSASHTPAKITSEDEIKFTRNVAEFATEELVAKRVKK